MANIKKKENYVSLSSKILIILTITYLIFMILFGLTYYIYSYSNISSSIKTSVNNSARKLTINLKNSLIGKKYYDISDQIYQEMLFNNNLARIVLLDKEKEIVFDSIRNKLWLPIKNLEKNNDDYSLYSGMKNAVITHKDINVGEIKLFISSKQSIKELRDRIADIGLKSFILFTALFSVLYIVLNSLIIKPITSLTRHLSLLELSEAEYSTILFDDNNDEIGELSNHFSSILSKLNHTINQKNSLVNLLAQNNNSLQKEIKERLIAERQVKSSQNYLETIINSMDSILFTIDQNFEIIQYNDTALAFIKKNIQNPNIYNLTNIQLFDEYFNLITSCFEEEKNNIISHFKNHSQNKVEYYKVFINVFNYKDNKNALIRMENITESMLKDEQLYRSLKMDSIRDLAGGIAHDFNNILGGIVGSVFLAKLETKDNDESLLENLQTIEIGAKRATELVKQLLSISGNHTFHLKPFDIKKAVENVYKLITNSFDKSINISLSTDLLLYDGSIIGDQILIEQVILNISLNASQAMTVMHKPDTKWGGDLTINLYTEPANKHVSSIVSTLHSENYHVIEITDNGVGIKEENITRIFDPFFSTKKDIKGSGLGLSVVYNIVKQHQGHIQVSSNFNNGTKFLIFLPVYSNSISNNSKKTNSDLFPKGTGTVLVIEDEKIMQRVVREMLIKCGYSVIITSDGLEGIETFKRNPDAIDVILLDMIMPKISGKETYRDLKKIKPDIKVLLTSGFQMDERVEKTLEMGADEFIQKPYYFKELAEKMFLLTNKL